jgi:tRNA modification GTPase
LREAADAIEAEGVRRALERAEEADLRIVLVEADNAAVPTLLRGLGEGDLVVKSKADLSGDRGALAVSAKTGQGIAELDALIASRVAEALGREEAPVLTRARHRRLVEEARAALMRAIPALDAGAELAAEDVRVAADQIGRLTGRIDVEDLLGEIFSSFCIGK